MKTSEIRFIVTLDEDKIPARLEWEASDSGVEGRKPAKATMVSIWDPKDNTTLRIDLWTKDMLVDDMKRFFYENFATMADTYLRSTNDAELAAEIRQFADSFGKKIAKSAGK
ncbi:MAG TPA: gliding motility protein GldC [Bacteroidia bacterium]|nr:gliding motility protein GldC [Bacteroidia bacterium]HNQ00401.1 gliding motility protein GldC [Bacteroidia bacterium]